MRHDGLQIMSFWRVRHVNVHLAQVSLPANGRFVPFKLIGHDRPETLVSLAKMQDQRLNVWRSQALGKHQSSRLRAGQRIRMCRDVALAMVR